MTAPRSVITGLAGDPDAKSGYVLTGRDGRDELGYDEDKMKVEA